MGINSPGPGVNLEGVGVSPKNLMSPNIQQTTAIAATTIAETTTIEDKLSEKTTVLEEIELGLFTGFEDTTALEDKKSLTVFSAIAVVCCNC